MTDIETVRSLFEQIRTICKRHIGDLEFNVAFVEAFREMRDDFAMDDDEFRMDDP